MWFLQHSWRGKIVSHSNCGFVEHPCWWLEGVDESLVCGATVFGNWSSCGALVMFIICRVT